MNRNLVKNSIEQAVNDYRNGNWSSFRAWIKRCPKIDLLDSIEYAHGQYGIQRHEWINACWDYLR